MLFVSVLIKSRALRESLQLYMLVNIERQEILSIIHLNLLNIINAVCFLNSLKQCKNYSGRCLLGK